MLENPRWSQIRISSPWVPESHPFQLIRTIKRKCFRIPLSSSVSLPVAVAPPPRLGLLLTRPCSSSLGPSLQPVLPVLGPQQSLWDNFLHDLSTQGRSAHTPAPTRGGLHLKEGISTGLPQHIPLTAPSAPHSRNELSALNPSCWQIPAPPAPPPNLSSNLAQLGVTSTE